jgi:NADP-dependent alcohol dehydrogenase
MRPFIYQNPTKLLFGETHLPHLGDHLPDGGTVLLCYGQRSAQRSGALEQVTTSLSNRCRLIPFGGIEPNPDVDTLMEAVTLCRREPVDFCLALGGGSVVDGTKFIAAAARTRPGSEWSMVTDRRPLSGALPIGCMLTLGATGSESNPTAVISCRKREEKRVFSSPWLYPRFALLQPSLTLSLPWEQTQNAIVDAFVHVLEQTLSADSVKTPLQDRLGEAILLTLLETANRLMQAPQDLEARGELMWCATMALNGLVGLGRQHDWSTHHLAHELTALYGLAHGRSLAVILPGVWRDQLPLKEGKLKQLAQRVFGLSAHAQALEAIQATESFFHNLGVSTRLRDYGIEVETERIVKRLAQRGALPLGEARTIDAAAVRRILQQRQ